MQIKCNMADEVYVYCNDYAPHCWISSTVWLDYFTRTNSNHYEIKIPLLSDVPEKTIASFGYH